MKIEISAQFIRTKFFTGYASELDTEVNDWLLKRPLAVIREIKTQPTHDSDRLAVNVLYTPGPDEYSAGEPS